MKKKNPRVSPFAKMPRVANGWAVVTPRGIVSAEDRPLLFATKKLAEASRLGVANSWACPYPAHEVKVVRAVLSLHKP